MEIGNQSRRAKNTKRSVNHRKMKKFENVEAARRKTKRKTKAELRMKFLHKVSLFKRPRSS